MTEQPSHISQTEQKKRLAYMFAWIVVTTVIVLWLMIAEVGPVGAFMKWQVERYGGYYPKATFGVVWVILNILLLALFHLIQGLLSRRPSK